MCSFNFSHIFVSVCLLCALTLVQNGIGFGVPQSGCVDEVCSGDWLRVLHIHPLHLQKVL